MAAIAAAPMYRRAFRDPSHGPSLVPRVARQAGRYALPPPPTSDAGVVAMLARAANGRRFGAARSRRSIEPRQRLC